jgi:hypothetical protein
MAVSQISKAKYKMPARQKPDGVAAGSFKRHASRFYHSEGRTLPYRAIPPLDEESPHPSLLVVRERNTDTRQPLQGVCRVERPAEDSVDGGQKGNGEVEEPLEGPGHTGRRKMQQGSTRLLLHPGRGETVPALAENDVQSEASEWELRERREREERRRAEAEELGADVEEPLFPQARLHGIRRRGVGGEDIFLLSFLLVRLLSLWTVLGGGQRKACKVPPSRGQRRGNGQKCMPPKPR